jgi:hypothetical protein
MQLSRERGGKKMNIDSGNSEAATWLNYGAEEGGKSRQ